MWFCIRRWTLFGSASRSRLFFIQYILHVQYTVYTCENPTDALFSVWVIVYLLRLACYGNVKWELSSAGRVGGTGTPGQWRGNGRVPGELFHQRFGSKWVPDLDKKLAVFEHIQQPCVLLNSMHIRIKLYADLCYKFNKWWLPTVNIIF